MASKKQEEDSDQDLDDLLDDALQDFKKSTARKKTGGGGDQSQDKDWTRDCLDGEEKSKCEGGGGLNTPPNSFADLSLFQKAMEERQEMLKELDRVAIPTEERENKESEARSSSTSTSTKNKDEKPSGAATSSSSSSSSLPRPPPMPPLPTEEDVDRLLAQVSLEDGGERGAEEDEGRDDLMPMMEHMMQTLLSKDLLYPAVKDLADRYPDWLAENRQKLAEEEFDRYNKQFDVTQQICAEFERQGQEDDAEEKRDQFERVMNLMQAMQMLGTPPEELGGGGGGGVGDLPGPDQCRTS